MAYENATNAITKKVPAQKEVTPLKVTLTDDFAKMAKEKRKGKKGEEQKREEGKKKEKELLCQAKTARKTK